MSLRTRSLRADHGPSLARSPLGSAGRVLHRRGARPRSETSRSLARGAHPRGSARLHRPAWTLMRSCRGFRHDGPGEDIHTPSSLGISSGAMRFGRGASGMPWPARARPASLASMASRGRVVRRQSTTMDGRRSNGARDRMAALSRRKAPPGAPVAVRECGLVRKSRRVNSI